MEYIEIAIQNQKRAREIIRNSEVLKIWRSIGAEPRLVGSLKMGLLMKRLDIDLHIYSDPLLIIESFAAMERLAENPAVRKIEYKNLLNTPEKCIEWHAWYQDWDDQLWQIDMIHMPKGSQYDGYFENVALQVTNALTPETHDTILKLKYETPDNEHIQGIEYYKAVIQDNIRTYPDFTTWRRTHKFSGIIEW